MHMPLIARLLLPRASSRLLSRSQPRPDLATIATVVASIAAACHCHAAVSRLATVVAAVADLL